MADTKAPAPLGGGMTVDPKLVRELADMLTETGLTEIEVEEGDKRIRVARAAAVAAPLMSGFAAPAPTQMAMPVAAEAATDAAPALDTANAIKSPMVGTAYLAPEPGADQYVVVGDKVKRGDTILIVEAMKVMNPITAPADGILQQLLVGNGEPVEFGQPLAIVS